ncbi:MAG: hypothetical protein IKI84_09555 [Clostridia bacterium]|nr:hypothetical protein [Clostridia bacterium]
MYCYRCGAVKTGVRCPICGADEKTRCVPRSAEGKALRMLFDMQDIGPESTIGDPGQFELLVTDILPGEKYVYFRMQLHFITSVHNVGAMLMDQIRSGTLPDSGLYAALCESAGETGFSLDVRRRVIEAIYEMIGWQIPGTAAGSYAPPDPPVQKAPVRYDPSPAPMPVRRPAEKKEPAFRPVAPENGRDLIIRMMLSEAEVKNGCVKKTDVRRRERCVTCSGSGRFIDKICYGCGGVGACEADRELTLKFDGRQAATNYRARFQGLGDQGIGGGKDGDLYVLVDVKISPAPKVPAKDSFGRTDPAPGQAKKPYGRAPTMPVSSGDPAGINGRDLVCEIVITPEENWAGCQRRIIYERLVSCAACQGRGRDGYGRACPVCSGKQTSSVQRTMTVTVTPHPGQERYTLPVLRGQGDVGLGGNSYGNLIVHVRVDKSAASASRIPQAQRSAAPASRIPEIHQSAAPASRIPQVPRPTRTPVAAPVEKKAGVNGGDVVCSIQITPEENITGCYKEISYERMIRCASCGGNGTDGHGRVCPTCGGRRNVVSLNTLTVTVAPHPRQRRYTLPAVKGQGNVGPDGTCFGNLIVHVRVG